jgi:ATP-dependent Clp protease ATP-binding subunit ClpB
VGQHFRPEFINRIDETVVFHPLSAEQIQSIARIQLAHLAARLKQRDMTLNIDEAALDFLSRSGYDPIYGARPLKRAIQQYLENPLAQDLLSGHYFPGDTIQVGVKGDVLTFSK